MGEYNEKLNAEDIASIQSKVLLPDVEPINPYDRFNSFASMCDCHEKIIKFANWSCVIKCCSECSGVLVIDA